MMIGTIVSQPTIIEKIGKGGMRSAAQCMRAVRMKGACR